SERLKSATAAQPAAIRGSAVIGGGWGTEAGVPEEGDTALRARRARQNLYSFRQAGQRRAANWRGLRGGESFRGDAATRRLLARANPISACQARRGVLVTDPTEGG